MMSDARQDLLASVLDRALKAGASACDGRISEVASLSANVRLGKLESVEREENAAISLRCFVGQRQAHVSGSDVSPDSLDRLVSRCVEMARLAPEDRFAGLPDIRETEASPPSLDRSGDAQMEPARLEALAREAETAALAVAGVDNSGGAGASWSSGQSWVAASNGFSGHMVSGSVSLGLSVTARSDTGMERDYAGRARRRLADLPDPAEIGREAGERAVARINPRKIASRRAPVIYERRLAGRLIAAFVSAISGPSIARGVSFLKHRMGEAVFAPTVSIIDDPFRPGGFGSRPFDGEGRPVSRKALIDQGVLTQWLLNSPSARQLGLAPNGFASPGFGDPPGVTISNLHVEPGTRDLEGLMVEAGEGLLITDMFGPSINPNTGDYSVGVSGFWFEGGARAYPVSEVTVAGDLPTMFASLIPGSDLEFEAGINSPSLLIPDLALAGR
jgi:PmbA protein